jgi:hypothetical protein
VGELVGAGRMPGRPTRKGTIRMRRLSLLAAALLLTGVPTAGAATTFGGTATVRVATGSRAVCVAEFRNTLSPGVSLVPATVAYTSGGKTGSIKCVGSVNGHAVTGPGTIGDKGIAQGTCASGSISGVLSMTIPTVAGPVNLEIPAVGTFAAGVGLRPTGQFPGGFVFVPTRGNCVLTPATEIAVVVHGILST